MIGGTISNPGSQAPSPSMLKGRNFWASRFINRKAQVILSAAHVTRSRGVMRWLILTLWGLSVAGCATQQPPPLATLPPPPISSAPLPMSFEEQQQMILHLLHVLGERESEISNLRIHQQSQVKELQETTSEAARAEVKLRRLATEAGVASQLAEVEVALAVLQSTLGTERKVSLQALAQRLLDSASVSFEQDEYSIAADQVAQAGQFIEMLMDINSVSTIQTAPKIPFKVAISLRIKVDSHLRRQPRNSAAVLSVLQKMTPVTAHAYHGQWLHVQTEAGASGWVLAELLEAP